MVLLLRAINSLLWVKGLLMIQEAGQINALRLPVVYGFAGVKGIHATDHLGDRAETQLCHDFPHFLSNKGEIAHQVFRPAGEPLPQLRVLGGNAH